MTERLDRWFGIKPGEYAVAFSMFGYLSLVIASYVIAKTVRDALFLSKFGAVKLPWVYIGIAVLVGTFLSVYLWFARRTKHNRLLSFTLAFFISNVVAFWWLSRYQLPWLYPVVYIWAGIFGVIAPMQVWTLGNFILNTRQAKRMYGFIGAGGVFGAIVGGFFASKASKVIGTEGLLLGIAVALGICILLVNAIWGSADKARKRAARDAFGVAENEDSAGLMESLGIIRRSRYLLLIAALISVGSIVTTIVDFQFKAIAEEALQSKERLTVFFGDFYGYTGVAALFVQLFLTARLLHRLGIGVTIFLLPVGLMLGSGVLLVYTGLIAAVVLKSPDQLFKHSIDKSTVELLYLPIPLQQKHAVKSFIDTVIWRLADGTAGVLLLVLTTALAFTVRGVTVVNMVLIGAWLALAFVTRREYVQALREAIRRRESTDEALTGAIAPDDPGLLRGLHSDDDEETHRCLTIAKALPPSRSLVPHVEPLLRHPAAAIRAAVLDVLLQHGDHSVSEKVSVLLTDESPNVKAKALHFVRKFPRRQSFDSLMGFLFDRNYRVRAAAISLALNMRGMPAWVATQSLQRMLRSQNERARREAATALGGLRQHSGVVDAIGRLLQDPDEAVVNEALKTAAKYGQPEWVELVVPHLKSRRTRQAAREVLVAMGTAVLPRLRELLYSPETEFPVRSALPKPISRIGGADAVAILEEGLNEKNPRLRLAIIKGLNRIRQLDPEWKLEEQHLTSSLMEELRRYYRTLAFLAALSDPEAEQREAPPTLLQRYLAEQLEQSLETILRLLGLSYDPNDLRSAYFGLSSHDRTAHANAIELLDNLLSPNLRRLVIPILDDEAPLVQKLAAAEEADVVAQKRADEFLAEALQSDDRTLVLCALDEVRVRGYRQSSEYLRRLTDCGDAMVAEAAAHVLAAAQVDPTQGREVA